MAPFDNYIESMLQSGKTMESIAEEMTAALNAARKKQEEKERAEKELSHIRDAFIDILNASIDTNTFNTHTVAAVCTLAAMDAQKMTKQEVEDYHSKILREGPFSRVPTGSSSTDRPQVISMDKLAKDLYNAAQKIVADTKFSNNSKEDREAIERWLRRLGV